MYIYIYICVCIYFPPSHFRNLHFRPNTAHRWNPINRVSCASPEHMLFGSQGWLHTHPPARGKAVGFSSFAAHAPPSQHTGVARASTPPPSSRDPGKAVRFCWVLFFLSVWQIPLSRSHGSAIFWVTVRAQEHVALAELCSWVQGASAGSAGGSWKHRAKNVA